MRNSSLVAILTYREMVGRYRGSVLAILGSMIAPLLILAICIFAFGFLFRGHWGSAEGTVSTGMFALFILTTEALYSVQFPTITRFVVPVIFLLFVFGGVPLAALSLLFALLPLVILVLGTVPDFIQLSVYAIVTLVVAILGYLWFQKTKKGFAHVL